jgi:uncharacterized protein (TIGR03067 family)
MRLILASAALAAVLAVPVCSQRVFAGTDPDRRAATVLVFDDSFNALAAASISYSQPQWRDEYDGKFDELKGNKLRLGKNWWTSLDTITPLVIGGTTIPAGSYVLGLACSEDGEFSLLAIDSSRAMRAKMVPFRPDDWSGEIKAPLQLGRGKLDDKRTKMEIEITADAKQPSKGALTIRWGTHELRAEVGFGAAASSPLEGEWTGREVGGQGKGATMVVTGDSVRFDGAGGQERYVGVLRLDASAKPARGEITIEECSMKEFVGTKVRALFEVHGDSVKVAGSPPGDPNYPTGFKADGRTRVFEFQRAK